MARFPDSPRPAALSIKSVAPAFVMAAHNRHRRAVTQNVQYFELNLEFPPLTRAEFSPIDGFLAQQRGQVGLFEYVPHTHATPLGLGVGAAEVASNNQVKWSERFDLAPWSYVGTLVQGAAVAAPDGRVSAQYWHATAADSSATPYIAQSFTVGQLTGAINVSVYLKAHATNQADRSLLILNNLTTATQHDVTVQWAAGVASLGTTHNVTVPVLTAVGGGWYRCSFSLDLGQYWDASGHQFSFRVCVRGSQPSVDRGVYLWGAQLVTGQLTLPPYLRTWAGAVSRNAGPRVSLRQNAIAYSETFSPSYWAKGCAVLPATGPVFKKSGVSPTGGVAESWGTPANNGVYGGCLSAPTVSTTGISQYVFSAYVKKDTASQCGINLYDVSAAQTRALYVQFDAAGVPTMLSNSADAYGIESAGNGWYRIYIMLDIAGGGLTGHDLQPYLYPHSEDDGTPRQPEGTFIWGVQLEGGRTTPGPYLARASLTSANFALESGTELRTEGWLPSQPGVLKAGDVIRLAGHSKVYKVVADASSDAVGLATLVIEPGLQETPAPFEVVQVQDVPFLVSLAAEDTDMEWDENVWVRPTIKLVEQL